MVVAVRLYDQVIRIAEDYFGPAAPRFINRLISSHLHKKPEALTRKDLAPLSEWAKVTVALFTDDRQMVDEFVQRLRKAGR